jgi:hypothetical protein
MPMAEAVEPRRVLHQETSQEVAQVPVVHMVVTVDMEALSPLKQK